MDLIWRQRLAPGQREEIRIGNFYPVACAWWETEGDRTMPPFHYGILTQDPIQSKHSASGLHAELSWGFIKSVAALNYENRGEL